MKFSKKNLVKLSPLMMSLLIIGCGSEEGNSSNQDSTNPISPITCDSKYYCDSDNDGISDQEELTNGSNPNDPNSPVQGGDQDSDADGIKDGLEETKGWNKNDHNSPVQDGHLDSDADGIKDGLEHVMGWNKNDANSPVLQGHLDSDADGIKDGLEEVMGWNKNDADVPLQGGDLDSDADGIKDGIEYVNGWDKNDFNSPVVDGNLDNDGDGLTKAVETIEGWDDNDQNNPISSLSVENATLVLDNVSVPSGASLQASIQFGVKNQDKIYSTLNIADGAHVTWSVLDSEQNLVEQLTPTSEGRVSIPQGMEALQFVGELLTLRATPVEGGWFNSLGNFDETFTVTLAEIDSNASQVLSTLNGTATYGNLEVNKYNDKASLQVEFHFDDGSTYTTNDSQYVTWTVSPADAGVTVSGTGVVNAKSVDFTNEESRSFTIIATGQGPFSGASKEMILTVKAPVINDGDIDVSGIGIFKKPLTMTEVNALGLTTVKSFSELGQDWPLDRVSKLASICTSQGYKLAAAGDYYALSAKYSASELTAMGWPVSKLYVTVSGTSDGKWNLFNLSNGTHVIDFPFIENYTVACIDGRDYN
ncbi:TPA: thrombospondin type 3 repeat-containing protein [Vibrio cholerae]